MQTAVRVVDGYRHTLQTVQNGDARRPAEHNTTERSGLGRRY